MGNGLTNGWSVQPADGSFWRCELTSKNPGSNLTGTRSCFAAKHDFAWEANLYVAVNPRVQMDKFQTIYREKRRFEFVCYSVK